MRENRRLQKRIDEWPEDATRGLCTCVDRCLKGYNRAQSVSSVEIHICDVVVANSQTNKICARVKQSSTVCAVQLSPTRQIFPLFLIDVRTPQLGIGHTVVEVKTPLITPQSPLSRVTSLTPCSAANVTRWQQISPLNLDLDWYLCSSVHEHAQSGTRHVCPGAASAFLAA